MSVPTPLPTSHDGGDEKAPASDTGLAVEHSPKISSKHDSTTDETQQHVNLSEPSRWQRIFDIVFWVPPRCRWDPASPPRFSMPLNILFAFAGAFTVANLYYNHPILNILARDFGVPYSKVSQIPAVAQAGYAVGLFFLCPLGDLLKRRPFVLSLVLFTATMSIGLCLTPSLATFSAIQFITAVTTVTPQLMLPLVGDLAPPHRRAAALSVVVSGFILGILVARLLSGIISQFVSWRYVYWLSVALQYIIFLSLWAFMPDYPATNKKLNYFSMLWSIITIFCKHAILVQACLISFFTSATFTSFWTVLTFLLSGKPYYYDPVTIGLFALIGIATMVITPLYGRTVIDKFVPWFSVILGLGWAMLGICLGAYTGSFTVAGPILQAVFLDFGMQTAQIANRSAIYALEPKARNRVNTAFMVFTFFGQLTGTSVGAHIYSKGGWIASQSFSVGCIGVALVITFLRGPWEERWVGWHGGLNIWKKNKDSADGKDNEPHNHLRRMGTKEQEAANARRQQQQEGADLEKGAPEHDVDRALEETAAEDEDDSGLGDEEKNSASSKDDGIAEHPREGS